MVWEGDGRYTLPGNPITCHPTEREVGFVSSTQKSLLKEGICDRSQEATWYLFALRIAGDVFVENP